MKTFQRPPATALVCGLALVGALLIASPAGALPAGALPAGALAAVRPAVATRTATPASAGPTLPPAPVWKAASGAMPTRPAVCPPAPTTTKKPAAGAGGVAGRSSETGDALWPAPPNGTDPESYALFDHTQVTSPPTVPGNWSASGNNWKLASTRSSDTTINSNPQELCGVEGASADQAWTTTTGRPTTVIAVLDSGIEWCSNGVVDRIALNRAALPVPENAQGQTKPDLEGQGQKFLDPDPYDLVDSGVLNVAQYAADPRVAATVADYGGYFCASSGGYTGISPEDLIRTFGDPTLPGGGANPNYYGSSGPAGYTEAIAGWNVLDNNNDPFDDVSFGHGTGEANDMAGSADSLGGEVGGCPNCMILPVRVGTSFVTTGNNFANGVLFAVDSGASVVSEALGAVDATETGQQAIAYAQSRGVPIVGSAADEESEHQNLPGAMGHIIVVNSTNSETGWSPASYLYLNGCTNYGAEISVTVPSSSCSSEATGKAAGMLGLLQSAAADAVAAGSLADYPGLHNALGQPVPLSSNEVQQLVTMSADDVDFATAAPHAKPPAPADNYAVTATVPFATTTMFPTTPGYDKYTGWGRINAMRIVKWVSEGRIPPEAQIDGPGSFQTFSPVGNLVVTGMVGAVRSSSYRYQVDVAAGVSPASGSWRLAAQGTGQGSRRGLLATIPLAAVAALFPGGAAALTGGAVGPNGQPASDKFTFTIRVLVEDAKGLVGVDQASDFLHSDPALVASMHFGSSVIAPPRLAPIGPHGENVLLVALADGTIHALLPGGKDLPGWPVYTSYTAAHPAEGAYTSGAVTARPRGELIGGVAVGDLADAKGSTLDVVAGDMAGNLYAWSSAGKLLPGWPVHSNPAYSEPSARNSANRLLPDFMAAPALADLTGNGTLDAVEPSFDRHVYAFAPDGSPVRGWPVLVVDPSEVQSVDPTTNEVTFLPGANVDIGTELVDTPAIGALDGKGAPEVIIGSDEEYDGAAYANLGALSQLLSAAGAPTANSRVYAIWPSGSGHPVAPGAPDPKGFPDPGAFVPGWPAKIAQLDAGLLPTIGDGVTGSPALADLTGNGKLEVTAASSAGPIYELSPDGSSFLGYGAGKLPNVGGYSPNGGSILDWTMPAVGSPVVAPIGRPGAPPSLIAAAASVGTLLDTAFPGSQTPNENEMDTWSATTGALGAEGPLQMSDLQFLDQPIVANVNGSAAGGYVVEGSGLYDLRAYGTTGREAPDFPKFTGGWTTFGAAFGPWGSLADQVLVSGTRSGSLLVWRTPTSACATSGPWPQVHHDLWNTQDLSGSGAPAASCSRAPAGTGYRLGAADGGIFDFHEPFDGSVPETTPPGLGLHIRNVVAMVASPTGGYWVVGSNGGVYSFGARYHGSLPGAGIKVNDIVGAAPTFDGAGYWLVAADGAVYAFGDAVFAGSLPTERKTVSDIVGIASPDPGGYWLVGRDGGVFSFGDARFFGSCPEAGSACTGVGDVVGIASPDASGYWLAGRDGGVFSFGDARFHGSCPVAGSGCQGTGDITGIATPDAGGYWLAGSAGAVQAFGDAGAFGSEAGARLGAPIIGIS